MREPLSIGCPRRWATDTRESGRPGLFARGSRLLARLRTGQRAASTSSSLLPLHLPVSGIRISYISGSFPTQHPRIQGTKRGIIEPQSNHASNAIVSSSSTTIPSNFWQQFMICYNPTSTQNTSWGIGIPLLVVEYVKTSASADHGIRPHLIPLKLALASACGLYQSLKISEHFPIFGLLIDQTKATLYAASEVKRVSCHLNPFNFIVTLSHQLIT